jgi:hypothetical protein
MCFQFGGPTRTRTNLYLQTCTNSGHLLTVQSTAIVQSNLSVQTLDTPYLPRASRYRRQLSPLELKRREIAVACEECLQN